MADAKLKPGDECHVCSGTGMTCLVCNGALDQCDCAEDVAPCTCEVCDGRGWIDELAADVANALSDVFGDEAEGTP